MRLFLGTFLDKELVEKIPFDEIKNLFKEDLKPIKKENIHMTWIFLGNVEARLITSLQEIINKHINIFKGLIFKSKSLELWPPKRDPRLIVLSGELNKQISLSQIIQDLKHVCNPNVKEEFTPHITIIRFKKDKTINKKIELPKMENFSWQIKEISLVESVLTSERPNYEKIRNWDLN